MGALQRICNVETVVAFIFGVSVTYFAMFCAMFYAGYGITRCSQSDCEDEARVRMCSSDPNTPEGVNVVSSLEHLSITDNSTAPLKLPTVYAITPTYARLTQRVDLTSLCHTLMLVPQIIWIVVEDAVCRTQPVVDVLAKCKSVTSVHLATRSPKPLSKGRGISQRNAGLNWIRQNCAGSTATQKCRGVVYMMDDDNKYDLKLFEEIRKTKNVSVFPVAFAGGLIFEGPICGENGRASSWHVAWMPNRPMPIDMAGFAINVDLILKNEDAVIGQTRNGKGRCSILETCFLEHFTTRETAECIGGKEIMVWHVKTRAGYYNEKKNPSDKSYAV